MTSLIKKLEDLKSKVFKSNDSCVSNADSLYTVTEPEILSFLKEVHNWKDLYKVTDYLYELAGEYDFDDDSELSLYHLIELYIIHTRTGKYVY